MRQAARRAGRASGRLPGAARSCRPRRRRGRSSSSVLGRGRTQLARAQRPRTSAPGVGHGDQAHPPVGRVGAGAPRAAAARARPTVATIVVLSSARPCAASACCGQRALHGDLAARRSRAGDRPCCRADRRRPRRRAGVAGAGQQPAGVRLGCRRSVRHAGSIIVLTRTVSRRTVVGDRSGERHGRQQRRRCTDRSGAVDAADRPSAGRPRRGWCRASSCTALFDLARRRLPRRAARAGADARRRRPGRRRRRPGRCRRARRLAALARASQRPARARSSLALVAVGVLLFAVNPVARRRAGAHGRRARGDAPGRRRRVPRRRAARRAPARGDAATRPCRRAVLPSMA